MILNMTDTSKRQLKQVEQFKKLEEKRIPDDINYDQINSLRIGSGTKNLNYANQYQLDRLPYFGVSPADISVLLVYLEQRKNAESWRIKYGTEITVYC